MNVRRVIGYRRPGRLIAVMMITMLMLVVSVGCSDAASQSPAQPTPSPTEQQVASATPLPTATAEAPLPTATSEAPIPAEWATYTNQGCIYTISYPPEMQITDQGTSNQLLAFNLDTPGRGATNFIYVSVADQESPTGQEIIYNYDPAETEILLNMQVGESKALRDIADVAPWFTYERMPDTPIGGHEAQTYENAQPWEFPEGTKEIRYYLLLNGCTYLIGGYLDTMDSDEPGAIDEELFNQIVATIQLP